MNLCLTNWEESEALLRVVRTAVFIKEQGIPPEAEWDAEDLRCDHVLVVDDAGDG